jgi:hypothetical protein
MTTAASAAARPTAIAEGLISEEGVRSFHALGWWCSRKLFGDDEIARMRLEHERVWRGEQDGDGFASKPEQFGTPVDPCALRKHDSAWWINDYVLRFACHPAIGKIAAALMATPEARLWHDQLMWKPGQGPDGASPAGNVGWHQDYDYWRCSSTRNMVTAWIALQDTDEGNGCMRMIVGSHRWGLQREDESAFDGDLDRLRRKYVALGFAWDEAPVRLRAGEASFHHALTFHGSGPNRSREPRLSVIAHLMPDEARYAGPTQHHTSITFWPRPRAGERFRPEFHPLAWREPWAGTAVGQAETGRWA